MVNSSIWISLCVAIFTYIFVEFCIMRGAENKKKMRVHSHSVEALPKEREHYVLDNLNLVDWIIQKKCHISYYDTYYDDYQQEGRCGLIIAAIRYDESRGITFSTFAASYVSGYVKRFRREFVTSSMHMPRNLINLMPKVMSLYYEGYSYIEIMDKLSISSKEYSDIIGMMSMQSIDDTIGQDSEGHNVHLCDMIGSEDKDIVDLLGEERVDECINKVAESIGKHKDIWLDYIYPAFFGERVTNSQIADKYGCSQSYVNRILNKGKMLLQKYMNK